MVWDPEFISHFFVGPLIDRKITGEGNGRWSVKSAVHPLEWVGCWHAAY